MATSKVDQLRALREQRYAERPVIKRVDNDVDNTHSQSPVLPRVKPKTSGANAQRQAKWRAAHPDLNRQRNRDLMRKKRAAEKHP